MNDYDDDDDTQVMTIWTETVLEILYASLKKNRGDDQIKDALKDVLKKGFKRDDILAKVEKKIGSQASNRVRILLNSML